MPSHAARARLPRGSGPGDAPAVAQHDPDVLARFLEDAAHFPGGHADSVISVRSEADVSAALRGSRRVLPIGAQSSLTGGATPMGETLISTAHLNEILDLGSDTVRLQAGVTLAELDAALRRAGRHYPPAPTFTGAFIGGTIATNAAGAATFKYGTTRDWVRALTVVLASGHVLDLERGRTIADPNGRLTIQIDSRDLHVDVPRYRMPAVPKLSAGYFAAPGMDLIDLFIGSEGTLGVITEATLRVLPDRPAFCLAFVQFSDVDRAFALVRTLRDAAGRTWRSGDPHGIDVSAIEHMDRRSLALVRADGVDRANGVAIRDDTNIALLVTLDLPPGTSSSDAYDSIGRAFDPAPPDTPLTRFCRALADCGVLDHVDIAVPGDDVRAAQLLAVREAVPEAVNARVGRAKQSVDGRIAKAAADMIVPFDRLQEFLRFSDAEFARRGLDAAVWGHISDGNLHPNVIPRSFDDVESGKEAILACGREAIRLGGAPLAEHGVGRNPVKQQLLAEMYGAAGIEEMRHVKRVLDPDWKLAPGVVFTRNSEF